MVDKAQPGDRCDFIGTLIVVPDVAQLQTAGSDIILCHMMSVTPSQWQGQRHQQD